MPRSVVAPVVRALSLATGVEIRGLDDHPDVAAPVLERIDGLSFGQSVAVETDAGRYLLCRYHRLRSRVVVAGPYRRESDAPCSCPVLTPAAEEQLSSALHFAAVGFGRMVESQRARLELASQLEMIGNSVIAIASELDLEMVLRRIVDLARDVAGAEYAALGVPDASGELSAFITSGLSAEEEAAIGHPPHGLGVLGLLISEPHTMRLRDVAEHPASVGFPENHPPMKSFLGVPIIARGQVLGRLYLTDKRFSDEFNDEDARLVELLARHAGVAIENARLFQQVETQQQRLQHIIDQLPEAIVLVERHHEQVTLANRQASKLLGWDIDPPISVSTFLERNPRREPDGSHMTPERTPLFRSLNDGEIVHQREVEILRPDNQVITLLANSAPLMDEGRHITGAIIVFQDITQIRDAEQLKDDFLSLVSHELRTPLTTIQGGAYMLLGDEGELDRETRHDLLADVYHESRRLAILVENMVQLANIRAGRFAMETEPVPVYLLVARAIDAVRESAPDREFRIDIDRDLLVEGDFSRLDQVVRNLLHNAIKYAPGSAPVDISAYNDGPMVNLLVRDYGPGIDPDDLPHVFERFQRGARAIVGQRGGMGLGLYLSKHLVEAHGGRIWIGQPAGGGAQICFSVPAVIEDV